MPAAVGVVLGVVATVGLGFASWGSVRVRRRDLAVLRALGFDAGQLRRSVRVQSVATVFAAMVVGIPAGAVVGRAFAGELGVVVEHAELWPIVAGAVITGIVLSVAASLIPAWFATRQSPADGLRVE